VSADTKRQIDEEIRRIIDDCYATAETLLKDNIDKLHVMADALMEYETIDTDQIDDIMEGKAPRPPADSNDGSNGSGSVNAEKTTTPDRDEKDADDSVGGRPAGEH